jgi:hypothetical protein
MRTFVCGQKSALDLGPESAHAQRGLEHVIDGIGQGVVGCGFTGYSTGLDLTCLKFEVAPWAHTD